MNSEEYHSGEVKALTKFMVVRKYFGNENTTFS